MTNVKNYTDKELLARVKSLDSYNHIPAGYWLLAVRSNEDAYNKYDDKVYLFEGLEFVDVASCTTNSGAYGLKNFRKWNRKGAAVIKSDEWYYDVYRYGLHKGKMEALRQIKPMKYYRDGNGDTRIDETGEIEKANNYTNFHCNDYTLKTGIKSWVIGGWSTGCIVCNDLGKYHYWIKKFELSKQPVSLCLIKEF